MEAEGGAGNERGNYIAPKFCPGEGQTQQLESSLHLSMTSQPFAVLATSKKDATSTMIYTNNQIPKFIGFFSPPFHVLPLMLQPPHTGAITALVKSGMRALHYKLMSQL